jgi:hypothetical protein
MNREVIPNSVQAKAENAYLTNAFVAIDWAVIKKWMLPKLGLENVDCIQLSLKYPVFPHGGPSHFLQSKDSSSSHEQLASSQEWPCAVELSRVLACMFYVSDVKKKHFASKKIRLAEGWGRDKQFSPQSLW